MNLAKHMPRNDKTFSDGDIIRIWCKHLTDGEKRNVMLFFYVYIPLIQGVDVILAVLERNSGDRRVRTLIKIIRRLWATVLNLKPDVLNSIIPDAIEKQVKDCLLD